MNSFFILVKFVRLSKDKDMEGISFIIQGYIRTNTFKDLITYELVLFVN